MNGENVMDRITTFFWRTINMRSKDKNLPPKNARCLVCIPGKRLETMTFRVPCAGTTGSFQREYDSFSPKTGMLWVLESEILDKT